MYVIDGTRSASVGAFIFGGLLMLVGFLISASYDGSVVFGIILLAIGGVVVVSSLRELVIVAPRLQATDAGVSFSGGSRIPWTAIKRIYVGTFDVSYSRTASIAFDFQRRRTMFRLPIRLWLTSPLAVGDIDISPATSADHPEAIAAKLEAMRVRAVGSEDGITVGESALPAARAIVRDR